MPHFCNYKRWSKNIYEGLLLFRRYLSYRKLITEMGPLWVYFDSQKHLFRRCLIERAEYYRSLHSTLFSTHKKRQRQSCLGLSLIKGKLADAYKADSEPDMSDAMIEIMDLCKATHNKHFRWFGTFHPTRF